MSFLKKIDENKKNLPSISSVFRVKNAEFNLENAVLSVVPLCTEIIIVDNNSSDGTLRIANKLKNKLSGIVDVKIFNYNHELAVAGNGYLESIYPNKQNSLAEYYKYCFSKASCNYVMKFDANCIMLPSAIKNIQKKIRKEPYYLIYRGAEIYGKRLNFEAYIFKNDNSFDFFDGTFYEYIKFNNRIKFLDKIKCYIFRPCFIHIKRINYIYFIHSEGMSVKELYK
ncbi:glycosyltransferase family 2 protein [Photobacterium phosphoreum]|uniref:glycosyltransferase family 2 protein n=1 Tax=Photobacterium phosphoreum TaxID=659 RepID=UPI0039AFE16C